MVPRSVSRPEATSEPTAETPTRYFVVPGAHTVTVQYFRRHDCFGHRDVIEYAGTPAALLSSGMVTADMLVGPGTHRRGRNGRGWRAMRSWRYDRNGVECAWLRITRVVADDRPETLPYGREAFEADEAWRRLNDGSRPGTDGLARHRVPRRNVCPEVRS